MSAGPAAQTSATTLTRTCEVIVELIAAGHPAGADLLYSTFFRPLRIVARKHCPEYAEDCVHDTILTVKAQIEKGYLKTPAALPGYVKTIAKRFAWNKNVESETRGANGDVFDWVVQTKPDDRGDPEQQLQIKERSRLLRQGLEILKPREREILTRFYLEGQTPSFICRQMQLTDTQFRLQKSRSKQKLEEFAARRLRKPTPRID